MSRRSANISTSGSTPVPEKTGIEYMQNSQDVQQSNEQLRPELQQLVAQLQQGHLPPINERLLQLLQLREENVTMILRHFISTSNLQQQEQLLQLLQLREETLVKLLIPQSITAVDMQQYVEQTRSLDGVPVVPGMQSQPLEECSSESSFSDLAGLRCLDRIRREKQVTTEVSEQAWYDANIMHPSENIEKEEDSSSASSSPCRPVESVARVYDRPRSEIATIADAMAEGIKSIFFRDKIYSGSVTFGFFSGKQKVPYGLVEESTFPFEEYYRATKSLKEYKVKLNEAEPRMWCEEEDGKRRPHGEN
jgi:hypothetical protein